MKHKKGVEVEILPRASGTIVQALRGVVSKLTRPERRRRVGWAQVPARHRENITVVAGSVKCFIRVADGAILKGDWKQPEPKQHARGSIYSEEHGMEAFDPTGYIIYLR